MFRFRDRLAQAGWQLQRARPEATYHLRGDSRRHLRHSGWHGSAGQQDEQRTSMVSHCRPSRPATLPAQPHKLEPRLPRLLKPNTVPADARGRSIGASTQPRFPAKYHETISPGPGYYTAGGFSRSRSSPKYHFSKAPRDTTRVLSSDTPGIVTSWYGDDVVRRSSRHPNPPAYHFGHADARPRSTGLRAEFDSQPGPAEYADRADSAVGRQRDSRRSTSPRPRAIGMTREQREKVFMNTRDMTLAGRWRGGQTPGPGAYSPSLPIMPKKRLNTPSHSFSRSARACLEGL